MIVSAMPRRHCLMALSLLSLGSFPALALPMASPSRSAMLAFDALYIPALFLTGSAGKSAKGPELARQAMARLMSQWPLQRAALTAAVPGQATWQRALAAVQDKLREADTLVTQGQWEASHEVLEHVRNLQFDARQALGMDYELDRFTAFHAAMERLAGAKTAQGPQLEADYVRASVLWRQIETLNFNAQEHGLNPAQLMQLNTARQEESTALSRLSQALRGASEADILKAAAATKGPFVKAYLAFGAAG